jgi:hypothetical protein
MILWALWNCQIDLRSHTSVTPTGYVRPVTSLLSQIYIDLTMANTFSISKILMLSHISYPPGPMEFIGSICTQCKIPRQRAWNLQQCCPWVLLY